MTIVRTKWPEMVIKVSFTPLTAQIPWFRRPKKNKTLKVNLRKGREMHSTVNAQSARDRTLRSMWSPLRRKTRLQLYALKSNPKKTLKIRKIFQQRQMSPCERSPKLQNCKTYCYRNRYINNLQVLWQDNCPITNFLSDSEISIIYRTSQN